MHFFFFLLVMDTYIFIEEDNITVKDINSSITQMQTAIILSFIYNLICFCMTMFHNECLMCK